MRNHFFFFLVLLISSCHNNAADVTQKNGPGDTYTVNSDDAEMNKATEKAKQTLYQFDLALKIKTDSQNNFSLKVRFPIKDGGEQLWIDDIYIENGNYIGVVGNRPYWVKEIKLGDTIKVNKPDISDWMYLENNILRGGYTTRLLRSRMSSSERKEFDAALLYKIEE